VNKKAWIAVLFVVLVCWCGVFWLGRDPETGHIERPKTPLIGDYTLAYKNYDDIVSMIKGWEHEAPLLVETGTYGKTSGGNDCFYFRLSEETSNPSSKVLVTACIHGNEPWSTSTMMSYAGWLLSEYGKNSRITKILQETEVYFVPVVSPDSYPFSRKVEGVDPNRDFPTPKDPERISVTPVQNLRVLFMDIKPNAVLSGHTYGRIFLVPWGDTKEVNPNKEDYERVASEMARSSGYKWMKISQLYGHIISGTEADWYHRNGAFAMVMEFGSHQRKPSESETESEFERTKEAFLFFLEESTKVDVDKQ